MLKAENRLKGQAEFSRILKEGQRSRGQFLVIAATPRQTKAPRVGIIVSKKVAKKAVDRNRIRRIVSHLFSHVFTATPKFDVVVHVTGLPAATVFNSYETEIQAWQKKLPSS